MRYHTQLPLTPPQHHYMEGPTPAQEPLEPSLERASSTDTVLALGERFVACRPPSACCGHVFASPSPPSSGQECVDAPSEADEPSGRERRRFTALLRVGASPPDTSWLGLRRTLPLPTGFTTGTRKLGCAPAAVPPPAPPALVLPAVPSEEDFEAMTALPSHTRGAVKASKRQKGHTVRSKTVKQKMTKITTATEERACHHPRRTAKPNSATEGNWI